LNLFVLCYGDGYNELKEAGFNEYQAEAQAALTFGFFGT